jgi:hypothetical protein
MTDMTLTAIVQQTTEQPEAPFEMANLRPEKTGLPFVVFVSQQGGVRHGPRIKLSPLPRYNPAEALVPLPDTDLALVTSWIELNRTTIEQYWSGEIAYTEDMLARIESV